MLTPANGHSSIEQTLTGTFWQVAGHPRRHLMSATVLALAYSAVKNKMELSSEMSVFPGAPWGVDLAFYLTQMVFLAAIAGNLGNILDASRELKQGAGTLTDTRPVSERYKEARCKTVCFTLYPKAIMTLLVLTQRFFTPLQLDLMFSGRYSSSSIVLQTLVYFPVAAYTGYLLASIALNMNFVHNQVISQKEADNLLHAGSAEGAPGGLLEEAVAPSCAERAKTRMKNHKFAALLPSLVALTSLTHNLWMMTTDRPAISGHVGKNEAVWLVYTGLSMVAASVFGFAADKTNHIMADGNVGVESAPLVKAPTITRSMGILMLLWVSTAALEPETIGLFLPDIIVPDIHNDSGAAQDSWKAFLCVTLLATSAVAAVVQNKLHSGIGAIKRSPVATQGRQVSLFGPPTAYDDLEDQPSPPASVNLAYGRLQDND